MDLQDAVLWLSFLTSSSCGILVRLVSWKSLGMFPPVPLSGDFLSGNTLNNSKKIYVFERDRARESTSRLEGEKKAPH